MLQTSKTKRRLNDKQLAILHELYCYRLATSSLLVDSLQATNINDINRRLQLLMKHGYVSRMHENTYRLIHKPASYYLTSDGANALATNIDRYSKRVLASIKRMKQPSPRFIWTSLSIYGISNLLSKTFGGDMRIFTASETAKYNYFPSKRPDLYIQHQNKKILKQYFLLYLETNKPIYANLRRIKDYGEYINEGEWDITNTPPPALLLVCDKQQLQGRALIAINNLADEIDDELEIYITSKEELNHNPLTANWINVFNPEESIKLAQ